MSTLTDKLRDEAERRERAEVALQDSEEQFYRFVAEVKDYAVFLLDPQGYVVSWNAGAERMKGYRASEIIGQHFSRFYPQEAIDRGWPPHELKVASAEGRFEDEGWRVRKDGTQFWANVVITALRNSRGETERYLKITRDLTERKMAEEQLRHANIELEQRVQDRTTELRKANEALKEQNERKDEFLAMLAHELRNPLAPIRNGLHILRLMKPEGEPAAQALDIMDKQVHHLTSLVNDLLDVSRVTRGKIHLHKERLDAGAAVQQAVATVRLEVEARQQRLTTLLPPEPVLVEADPTRLEQVMVNLLQNATKYTKPGGFITVTVAKEGSDVAIHVRDSGVGISPQLLPHVFDLFMQADRTLDRSEGGLGIGLTMVKRLVELHGGRVEAKSDGPGRGSEFTVFLPALPAEPAAQPAANRPGLPRVLIVEDVPDTAETFALMLQAWGHETRAVHDGPSALIAFRTFQPDVVLLDIGLPGMSGYDVARQIRREASDRKVLIVAVSGYGSDESRQQAHQAGFDLYMTKPVDPMGLEKLLSRLRPPAS